LGGEHEARGKKITISKCYKTIPRKVKETPFNKMVLGIGRGKDSK